MGIHIPEFGIDIPDDTTDHNYFDNIDMWSWDPFVPQVEELVRSANRSHSVRIMMADHLQRMEFLLDREAYKDVLPILHPEKLLGEDDLLINIRASEILSGVAHYPLVPTAFYEYLVAQTGLTPVFVGQLDDSAYVRQLRRAFPNARFIESRGARADFDLIRSAKNIVVAISTFSWLAAWLSEADNIFLPLSGFFNPSHHREVDLLPLDDVRYRYFLFPLNYGLPEEQALEHHERMRGRWKEISRNQVALLKSASPFLRPARENYDSGLPKRVSVGAKITFDSVWYAHQYLDAAMEISEGWFEDPLHHYLEVGRLRGYRPTRASDLGRIDPSLQNVALHKEATQSSLSSWSRGATLAEDAGTAVDGKPWESDGFHTGEDDPPWWQVDLKAPCEIHAVRIFNRDRQPEWIQKRASPLLIDFSDDGKRWERLFQTEPGQVFGGYGDGSPFVWAADAPVRARYIRLSVPRREVLHLSQVEVYGRDCDEA